MNEFTRMLMKAKKGDARAAEALLPLVYDELRRLASRKMSLESAGHTLQPTALVHEAWLRLAGTEQPCWENRAHFFGAAAEAMRRILVDHARRKQSQKRGAGAAPEALNENEILLAAPPEELLEVNDALDKLAAEDPQAAELVKLRYFVGMTMEETATAMALHKRTAESIWTYAKAWLGHSIRSHRG
jgi:RNA polymerase sigma factor (TIGR02999 family)